jgi:hypothetical protein
VGLYEAKRAGRDRVVVMPSQAAASEPSDPNSAEPASQRRQIDTEAR